MVSTSDVAGMDAYPISKIDNRNMRYLAGLLPLPKRISPVMAAGPAASKAPTFARIC